MGCDMVVALAPATGNSLAYLAANSHRPVGEAQTVQLVPGRTFAAGESAQAPFVLVQQVRQTHTVLAAGPQGSWGYLQGVNDHRVAVGVSSWQSRFQMDRPGLLGPDLVRLVLERAGSARHGLEVLTDLIVRHGQGSFANSPEGEGEGECGDHIFLIADPQEAFAVEAAGSAWAAQEIGQVRAAGDVAVIRQDWNRLAPGLADRAIAEGWWEEDGSKLDFLGALCETPTGKASALRRWGRITWLIEKQNGHIDGPFLRRLLADHYESTPYEVDPLDGPAVKTPVCQHAQGDATVATAVSGVVQISQNETAPPVYWVALGPPCLSVHFPLLLDGELPAGFAEAGDIWLKMEQLTTYGCRNRRCWQRLRDLLGRLQTRFEQELEEFLTEAAVLKQRGEIQQMRRLASSMMQSHVERLEETVQQVLIPESPTMEMESLALGGVLTE
jgi:secernin